MQYDTYMRINGVTKYSRVEQIVEKRKSNRMCVVIIYMRRSEEDLETMAAKAPDQRCLVMLTAPDP
jgi:hypothetical protein